MGELRVVGFGDSSATTLFYGNGCIEKAYQAAELGLA